MRCCMKVLVEIRSAEGGEDSKLLVDIMAKAYVARCKREGL